MSSRPARTLRRRTVVVSTISLLATVMAAACGGKQPPTQAANGPIGVETSQLFVTIYNRAGAPLTDVDVAIIAVSSQRFSKLLPRLEDGEKQDISLSNFSGRDGTSFNLRFNTPKTVEVKAVDVADKKYDVTVPWR